VKSLELLRSTFSLPIPSIPNTQTTFFYYRIPILGTGGDTNYDPDYSQMTAANIKIVRLLPTNVYSPSRYLPATAAAYGFNGIFHEYQELVDALNRATLNDPNSATLGTRYVAGDITFSYDDVSQKIIFQGNNYENPAPGILLPQFYYIPCGFNDPNLITVQNALIALLGGQIFQFEQGYTLNKRLGFLWNGAQVNDGAPNYGGAPNYTYPIPNFVSGVPWLPIIRYFADTYADMLHTQNIFLYCDIVGGSTQDTNIKDNLLAVIPVYSGQLGTQTYQSSQSCPLTKIPKNIYEISIIMKTDTGADLYLPVSGFVNIEFAVTY
tara:strand:+ start:533 stop:1501 length:969 start_codon:yes stop_codon:yes gene_type:complete